MSKGKVLIFHHTDLDGIGVKIIGMAYAYMNNKDYETFACNYHDVNEIVRDRIQADLTDVDTIIIADISVNRETAKLLNILRNSTGIDIILRDHHATAEWLGKEYEWAYVSEKTDGVERCGTYLLAREFPQVMEKFKAFVTCVDYWDTWKWVDTGNDDASRLNSLLAMVGEDEFTDYIMSIHLDRNISRTKELFDEWADNIAYAHQLVIIKTAKHCSKNMFTTTMTVNYEGTKYEYKAGIVFFNQDISAVSDIILEENKDIDGLVVMSLPRSISFRTKNDLEVPLGVIAKMFTGAGGGHPAAAGSAISKSQFDAGMGSFLDTILTNSYNLQSPEQSITMSSLLLKENN